MEVKTPAGTAINETNKQAVGTSNKVKGDIKSNSDVNGGVGIKVSSQTNSN